MSFLLRQQKRKQKTKFFEKTKEKKEGVQNTNFDSVSGKKCYSKLDGYPKLRVVAQDWSDPMSGNKDVVLVNLPFTNEKHNDSHK